MMEEKMEHIVDDFILHVQLIHFMLKERVNPSTYPFVVLQTEDMRTNLCLN
jgi:hypothetical protein